jgi:hypothetical protein
LTNGTPNKPKVSDPPGTRVLESAIFVIGNGPFRGRLGLNWTGFTPLSESQLSSSQNWPETLASAGPGWKRPFAALTSAIQASEGGAQLNALPEDP